MDYGWRVEGIRLPTGTPYDCKTLRAYDALKGALLQFVQSRAEVARRIHERLVEMRERLTASEWFYGHEIISSSLLFIYDDAPNGTAPPSAWMIDFAKTMALPSGETLTHTLEWSKGNREDGFLVGLNNLIQIWADLAGVQEGRGASARAVGGDEATQEAPPPAAS